RGGPAHARDAPGVLAHGRDRPGGRSRALRLQRLAQRRHQRLQAISRLARRRARRDARRAVLVALRPVGASAAAGQARAACLARWGASTRGVVTAEPTPQDPLSDERLRRGSVLMATGTTVSRGTALRRSVLMATGTLVSRGTGLLRTLLLVAAIGTVGPVADAFDIANTLPTMLFALVSAGAIQSVLMPQIMAAIQAENAQERLDKLLTLA